MIGKIDKLYKIILCILIFIILLFSFFNLNNVIFPLISLAANIFLILIYKEIKKILNINFSNKQKIIILISILLIYIFYFVSILNRKFIYYWDFSCYYNLQTSLENSFNLNMISGIRSFVGSTWSGEYGNFLCFFPQIIFNFTDKTINSYVLSCVLVFIPYIIISISLLLCKINNLLKIRNKDTFFLMGIGIFTLFPLLHATFIYGQPDIFGLAFIFLIIALTIDYYFEKLEPTRLFILLIVTFMLLITRRWYIYFIISYYICYGVEIIILNIRNKELFKIIKNCIIYLLIAITFFAITLFPLLKNVIASNFAYSYSYYMSGGFKAEIINQIDHVGYFILIIMIIGIIYGLCKKQYIKYILLFLLQYLITIFLFTRIQNMGLHHSLLLLPAYLCFIYAFIILINNKKAICYVILIIFMLNFGCSVLNYKNNIFSNISLTTPTQNDYDEIKEVCNWLKQNLNDNNTAYMITHNNTYNPDKFRNFYLPNKTISDYLPYGSAILGAHSFPTDLFDAKYIITSYPFENVSIEGKYNDVFIKLAQKGKFNLVKKFDMKNGINILIYKRVIDVDYEEANMYIEKISDATADYDYMYSDVINKYIKENNLK